MEKKQAEKKLLDKQHAPTKLKAVQNSSSKSFYVDALKKITEDQIITAYTRDKLMGFLEGGNKKDYMKFKRLFNDLLELHDAFDDDN